jgi:HK97 family phage major capsid protein
MKQARTIEIKRAAGADSAAGGASDEIELAISSEAPYERWFGIEILSHKKKAVDLSRLSDGRHPLLLNHDTEKQIGVITSARIDDDMVLRGKAKFSRSVLGQEIKCDVADNIRSLVSVGYMVDEMDEVTIGADGSYQTKRTLTGAEFEREMRALHGDQFYRAGVAAARSSGNEPPVFLVTRWQPFEASVVPVPADVTVGVGRSAGADPQPAISAVATPPETSPVIIRPTTLEIKIMNPEVKTPEPAELERVRISTLIALGDQYSKYIDQKSVSEAVRGGHSIDQFREKIMAAMESKHTDTSALHLGLSQQEKQRYSFGRALVASITGDWTKAGFERECSQAMAKMLGKAPEGFFVPFDAMQRDFNVGTSTEAGNLVATDLRTDLYTDVLRNALVIAPLGVRILPGLTSSIAIPRKTTAGSLGMLSEIGSASETNPNISQATLSPKRISAYVQVSKQALIQSSMALEGLIRDDLIMGAAVKLEDQYLNGTGANNITGLRYVTGIGTTTGGTNGLAPDWATLVALETNVSNSNAEPDRFSGYVVNTKTRGKFKTTQMGTNLPFIWQNGAQPLNGYRAAVTNTLPSNLTKGTSTTVCSLGLFGSDWSNMVVGLFGAPDITVDPYSLAATGQVQITLNQFADACNRQPAAFAHIPDWVTT